MAVYKVLTLPDQVLRSKSEPVEKINAGVLRAMDNIRDTMYAADGVGLAAPQIGIQKRMIAVDAGDNLLELINPEIIRLEGEQTGREGCLSVTGVVGTVSRAMDITVKARNRAWEEVVIEASGITARALQHEIDHLDGILFIDRATETFRERN
ncbi:MAG: peptide deformylase [Syntrophomonadaceae bacterium]|nr:peptide deformylase [Syntrophomonadaceae bacterium]